MQYRSMLVGLLFAAVTIIGAGAEPAPSPDTGRRAAAWGYALLGNGPALAESTTALAADFVPNRIAGELVPQLGLQVCAAGDLGSNRS